MLSDTDSTPNNELEVLASVADWAWRSDENLLITDGTPQVEALLGLSIDSLKGQHLTNILDWKLVIDRNYGVLKRAVSTQQRFTNIFVFAQHVDGTPRVLDINGAPRFAADGRFLGYQGTCTIVRNEAAASIVLQYFEHRLGSKLGEDYFELLVSALASALSMDWVSVARFVEGDPGNLHTLAVWGGGQAQDNFSYSADDPICQKTLIKEGGLYLEESESSFPSITQTSAEGAKTYIGCRLIDRNGEVVGILSCMSSASFSNSLYYDEVFSTIAERAAAEIVRLRAEERTALQKSLMDKAQLISGFGSWRVDTEMEQLLLSDAATHLLSDCELLVNGNSINSVVEQFRQRLPDNEIGTAARFWAAVKTSDKLQEMLFSLRTPRGLRWLKTIAAREYVKVAGGSRMMIIGVIKDVSAERSAQQQLRLLTAAVAQSSNAISITDLGAEIIYANPAFKTMTGYSITEAVGRNTSFLRSANTPQRTYKELWGALKQGNTWRGELNNQRKDGSLYWAATSITPLRDGDGNIQHYLSVQEDISDRRRHEEELLYQASHDSLTGLPNRLLAYDRLLWSLQQSARSKRSMALLFLDLDNFKQVNDTLGHEAGDLLLKKVALRLQSTLRDGDTVARLGGDEFLIILESADAEAAELSAKRILRTLAAPMSIYNRELVSTVSIGLTMYPHDGDSPEILMRNADSAMYRAKAKGKNEFLFFTEAMNVASQKRLTMETEFRRALERNEISLVYQPIVDTRNGVIVGAEALARWSSQLLGEISPLEFIPLAEELGLIVELGEFIVASAVSQCAHWRDYSPEFFMAINISPRQLRNAVLKQSLSDALAFNQLPHSSVVLEVTEGVLVDDVDSALAYLNELSGAGIQLAIDDFGTGYSSLSYLKTFPFDRLKIDRSFVGGALESDKERVLVRVMIDLAHQFGMTVVAEGVETQQQLALLADMGADHFQGYYFSKPLKAEDLSKQLLAST